jgi:hypothetical protein
MGVSEWLLIGTTPVRSLGIPAPEGQQESLLLEDR